MRKWHLVVAALLVGVISGLIGSSMTRHFGTSAYTIDYADFVSIMLSAVSLLMTLLGFFIAGLAFIGWNAISDRVHTKTEDFLRSGFQEGEALHKIMVVKMEELAKSTAYGEVNPAGERQDDDPADADNA